ncbi:MAG: hypothetical protein LBM64_05265 [Deltaproteobacteria bacterium]|jgi:hypothetical protein|nr:hypothetical protein [Deltaproteobacteria bacterium]
MKSVKHLALLGLAGLLAFTGTGCSAISSFFANNDAEQSAARSNALTVGGNESLYASPYTPDSLANYRLGREYAAAGRYELAREHYLLALAAANDRGMQDALVSELKSIDMMIKSLR